MEEKKKIVVVAKVGGIEIIVEGEKDEDVYELTLSKPQAIYLALDILNTIYKTGGKDLDNNAWGYGISDLPPITLDMWMVFNGMITN